MNCCFRCGENALNQLPRDGTAKRSLASVTPNGKLLNRDRIHAEGVPHRESPSPYATLPRIACQTIVVYSFRPLSTAGKCLLCVHPARAWPWRQLQNPRKSACAEPGCGRG